MLSRNVLEMYGITVRNMERLCQRYLDVDGGYSITSGVVVIFHKDKGTFVENLLLISSSLLML